jgi:hypothetical protein
MADATPDKTNETPKPKPYKGAEDWVAELIDSSCKDDKGKLDMDRLYALCEINGLNKNGIVDDKKKMVKDGKKGAGRARMDLGNMLRARARRRHGLLDIKNQKLTPPADFLAGCPKEPTETLGGEKIAKAKPVAPDEKKGNGAKKK